MIQSSKYKRFIFLLLPFIFVFFNNLAFAQAVDAGDDQTICTDVTTLNAKDPGGIGQWEIKAGFGKGEFIDAANPNTDVEEVGFGTNTYVWRYWKNGNESSDEVVITNWSAYAGDASTTCSDEAQLNGSDPTLIPGGSATGKWTTTDGTIIIDDNTQFNTTASNLKTGTNIFRWTITNPLEVSPCDVTWAEVTVTYSVGGPSEYNVTGSGTICSGGDAIIDVDGSDLGVTYKLLHDALPLDGTFIETGNNILGDGNSFQFIVSDAGEYKVKAEITAACFVTFNDVVSITETNLGDYTLSALGNDYYCELENGADLTLSGSDNGITYKLLRYGVEVQSSVGDGNAIIWSNNIWGDYTVEAVSTCTQPMTGTITIIEKLLPLANFVVSDEQVCTGSSVSFNMNSSEISVSYEVFLGATSVAGPTSGTGNAIDFTVTPPSAGDNYYTIKATSGFGCISNQLDQAVINGLAIPNTGLNISDPETCDGQTASILLSAAEANTSYQLRLNGSNTFVGAAQLGAGDLTFITSVLNVNTDFNILATKTDGSACSTQLTNIANVNVNALPAVFNLGSSATKYCQGSGGVDITLDGSELGVDYVLYNGATAINTKEGTGLALTWSGIPDGIYTIEAITASACSQTMNGSKTIIEIPLPTVSVTLPIANTTICTGESIQLEASGATNFSWDNAGSLTTPLSSNPIASPLATTTYTITGTDADGCSNTDNITINVNNLPAVGLGVDKAICEGTNVTLSTSANVDYSYAWSHDVLELSNVAIVGPSTNQTYAVTVTNVVTGCKASDNLDVVVNKNPVATAEAVLTLGDIEICNGFSADLTSSATIDGLPIAGIVTYNWGPILGIGQNKTVTPGSTATYTVTATTPDGCTATDDVSVTVLPLPIPSIGVAPSAAVCLGDDVTLTASATNGTGAYTFAWSHDPTTSALIIENPPVGTTNLFEVTAIDSKGCEATIDTNIVVNSLPTVAISGVNATYCMDETAQIFTGNPTGTGGIFTVLPITGNIADNGDGTGTFSPSMVPSGTIYNIYYDYTDGNGCTNNATATTEVSNENIPTPSISNLLPSYCETDGTTYTIDGSPFPAASESGVFALTNSSGANVGAGFTDLGNGQATINPATISNIDTYTLSYTFTNASGCVNTISQDFDIGVPITFAMPSDLCEGSGLIDMNTYLTKPAGVPNGNYLVKRISDGNTWSLNEATNPQFNTAWGNSAYDISYTVINGSGCDNSNVTTVTVHALTALSFTIDGVNHDAPNLNFCENVAPANLVANVLGGSYSGSTGISGATFDPATAAIGNNTITYTYTEVATGCASTVNSANVEVNEAPNTSITNLNSGYCLSEGITTLIGDPKNDGLGNPGTWATPTWTLAQFNNNLDGTADFNPSAIALANTYTIEYTVSSANGCTSTATELVEIFALPTVDFTGLPLEICQNNEPITLVGNQNGGVFSGTGLGAATVVAGKDNIDFDPAGLSGAYSITYDYTDANGCYDDDMNSTTIIYPPTISSVTGGGSYCEGAGGLDVILSNSEASASYELYRDGNATGNIMAGINAELNFGAQTLEGIYTVKATGAQCEEWMNGNAEIDVDSLPDDATGIIASDLNICPDGSTIYTFDVPDIKYATSYVWSVGSATIQTGNNTKTITVTYPLGTLAGVETISVHGNNGCGIGAASTIDINISEVPTLGAAVISGADFACVGEIGVTYSIDPLQFNFETEYLWETTAGIITSDSSASSVTVSFPLGSVSGNIRVRGVNSCSNSTWVTKPIAIDQIPDVSINNLVAADIITCDPTSQVLLNAASTENAANIDSWLWTTDAGGVILAGDENLQSPRVSHEGDFVVTIEVTKNKTCYNTDTITVGADRVAPIPSIDAHSVLNCNDVTLALQANATTPSTYQWSFTPPANIVGLTNTDNPIIDKPGTYTVVVTDINNKCTGSISTTVTQDITNPNITVTSPATDLLTCKPANAVVNIKGASTTLGATFQWSSAIAGVNLLNANDPINASGDKPGIYTLEVTDPANGCVSSMDVTVNEDKVVPSAIITNIDAENSNIMCNNLEIDLQATSDAINATFLWSNGGGNIVSNTGSDLEFATVDVAATYSVIATNTDNGCSSISATEIVGSNLTTALTTNITSASTELTCANSGTINLIAVITGDAGVGTFSWSGPGVVPPLNNNNVDVISAGTYTLTYSHSVTGCPTTANVVITADGTLPTIAIDPGSHEIICTDLTPTLTASDAPGNALGTTYLWTGPLGATYSDNTVLGTTVDLPGTYTITATTLSGCVSSANVTVTQNIDIPNISVVDPPVDKLTCINNTVNIQGASTTMGVLNYQWSTFVGGATITDSNDPLLATGNKPGIYTLEITNTANGCSSSLDLTIIEDIATPLVTALVNNDGTDLTCNNATVELQASAAAVPAATFTWATATGTIDATSGLNNEFAEVSSPADYTVVATNPANGCQSIVNTKTVTNINTTATSTTIVGEPYELTCDNGAVVTLDAVVLEAPVAVGTYSWSTSDGNITSLTNIEDITVDKAGTYTLTYKHSVTGCETTVSTTVTDKTALPTVAINAATYEITCSDLTLEKAITPTISASGDLDALTTYAWSDALGATYSAQTALTTTIDKAGTYIITATNPYGCIKTDNVTVVLNTDAPDISVTSPSAEELTCTQITATLNGASTTPAVTYLWTGPDPTITNETLSNAVTDVAGLYTLQVTDTDNGCISTTNVTVNEDVDLPIVTLTNVDAESVDLTCTNTQVDLTAKVALVPTATFVWSTVGTIDATSGIYDENVKVSTSTDYTVVATNPANGCVSLANTITVNDNKIFPTLTLTSALTELDCNNTTIDIDASTSTDADIFAWSTDVGTITAGQNSDKITVSAPGIYTLTATNSATGCETISANHEITQNIIKPNVVISNPLSYKITCSDLTETVNATNDIAGSEYLWTGPGIDGANNGLSISLNKIGWYEIVATAPNGCINSDKIEVVADTVTPDIQIDPVLDITCTHTDVAISGTSILADSYNWTRISGSGSIADVNANSTTVNGIGQFKLTVTTTSNGCTNSDSVEVIDDYSSPQITLADKANDTLSCKNNIVQLIPATPVANVNFLWSTGIAGANISDASIANPYVNKPGIYTLVATHPVSGCQQTEQIEVLSNFANPTISILPDANEITCTQNIITLNASASSNATNFYWSYSAGGNILSGGNNSIATISKGALYTLVAENVKSGCTSSGNVLITENKTAPVVSIVGEPFTITCTDPSLLLDANIDVVSTLVWSGPGIVANPTSVNPTINADGYYKLVATSTITGCKDSSTTEVKIDTIIPDISVSTPKVVDCNNPSVNLVGSSINATSFLWEKLFGDAVLSNASLPTASVNTSGDFKLTVTATNGCENSTDITVLENIVKPAINLAAIDDEILTCNTTEVTLNSSTAANMLYNWATLISGADIVNKTTATPTVNKAGNYTLTVIDPSNGCDSVSNVIVNSNYTEPVVVIEPVTEKITCTNEIVQLNAALNSVDAINFSWIATLGGNIQANENTTNPDVNAAGTYTVTAEHNITGCPVSASVIVEADESVPVIDVFNYFPNELNCLVSQTSLLANASSVTNKDIIWSTTNGNIVGAVDIQSPIADKPGNYTVKITNLDNGCFKINGVEVKENIIKPAININPIDKITCYNPQITISSSVVSNNNSALDYVWVALTGGNIVNGDNSFFPVIDKAAEYKLFVEDLGNNCKDSATVIVEQDIAKAIASVDVNPDVITCREPSITLNGSSSYLNKELEWIPALGFSGSRIIEQPSVIKDGTYNLVVTNLDNGCTDTSANVVVSIDTVTPIVTVNAPSNTITCNTSNATISASSNVDYNYEWTGIGNLTTPNLYTTEVDIDGFYDLKVESKTNGCISEYTVEVEQDKLKPTPPLINNIEACFGSANPSFIVVSGENVQWYADASLTTLLSTGNSYTPNDTEVGTHTYYATSTGANGCQGIHSEIILTIHTLPNNPVVFGNEICFGSPNNQISALSENINWYDNTNTWLGSGTSYIPTVTLAGSYSYYATQTNSYGCEGAQQETIYTIHNIPDAPSIIDDAISTCEETQNSGFTVVGTDIKWYSNLAGSVISIENFFEPTDVLANSYTYYATQTLNNCESQPATATLDIHALPSKFNITDGGSYCEGNADISVGLSGSQAGVNYELWLNDASLIADVFGTGAIIDFGVQTQVGNYTVYANNSTTNCRILMNGGTSISMDLLPVAAGIISGSPEVCQQETEIQYSIVPIANATGYIWTVPTGFTITSGDNSNIITVSVDNSAIEGNISVRGKNDCGEGSESFQFPVKVNRVPMAATNLVGNQVICSNDKGVQYSIDVIDGATSYFWTLPIGSTLVNGNGSRQITVDFDISAVNDNISVYGINSCGSGSNISMPITVNSLPSINIGGEQNLCTNSTILDADILPAGSNGLWEQIEGAFTIVDNSDPKTALSLIGEGLNKLSWTITNANGCIAMDTINIHNNTRYVNAGKDQEICSDTTSFSALAPLSGATWGIYDASAQINTLSKANSHVYNLRQGLNTFVWEVDIKSCISSDTVNITNNLPGLPIGGDDVIIEANSINLNADNPESGTIGTWKKISGGATITNPTDRQSLVTNLSAGANEFVWTVSRGICSLTDTVLINNTTIEDPEAGPNQIVCTDYAFLNATIPSEGQGRWGKLDASADIADVTAYNTRVSNLRIGENWFKWIIGLTEEGEKYDSVLIICSKPTVANAGINDTVCQSSTVLNGNIPYNGSGQWLISDLNVIISDITNPKSNISNLSIPRNELIWEITTTTSHTTIPETKVCVSSDHVIVVNNTPTTANVGDDQTTCDDFATLHPNTPTFGIASWSTTSVGGGIIVGNEVTNLQPDRNLFCYKITSGKCVSSDTVEIFSNKPSLAEIEGESREICVDNIVLTANTPIQGTGVWSRLNGSGIFSDVNTPSTTITDLGPVNTFKYTISKNGCEESDEITIYNNYVYADADANGNVTLEICDNEFQLNAVEPESGIGTWELVGEGLFDDPSDAKTRITNLGKEENILTWKIVNEGCESSDNITITNNTPSEAFAGGDQSVCGKEYQLSARSPIYGTGTWAKESGAGIFTDAASPYTSISNLSPGYNHLIWTVKNGICSSTSRVVITNNMSENVYAGEDRRICTDSISITTNVPSFGEGIWGGIINGGGVISKTGPNQYSIHELQDSNVFLWKVINDGCTVYDTLFVINNTPSTAKVGIKDWVGCSNSTKLTGNNPSIGAGKWEFVSGLSKPTFSNPNLHNSMVYDLAESSTTTLAWVITKENCESRALTTFLNSQPSVPEIALDDTVEVCDNTLQLAAFIPDVGTGQWELYNGNLTIDEPSISDTRVNNISFGYHSLLWKVSVSDDCYLSDTLVIKCNKEHVDAGADQTYSTTEIQLIGNQPEFGTSNWQGGNSVNIQTPNNFETKVTDLKSGANIFTYTIWNNGCASTDNVVINYVVMPITNFEIPLLKGCPPFEVELVNSTVGYGAPYTWDMGDGTILDNAQGVSHIYTEPGTYKVVLTATAPLGQVVSKDTIITIYENPEAVFDVEPKVLYIPDEHLSCFNYSINADSSIWYFGDGTSLSDIAPTYIYSEEDFYTVSLKVISENGCTDSIALLDQVEVIQRSNFYLPDAFTPNPSGSSGGQYSTQDRSNDVFYPLMTDGELAQFEMTIYNRSGVVVFQTDDVNTGWDGYYNNKLMPQDVYVYLVTGLYNSGKPFNKTGNVLLIKKDY